MELQKELAVFQRDRGRWIDNHFGDFVVIKNEEVLGFYAQYEEALRAGYSKFGRVPFLVKQVSITDENNFISIPVGTSC